MLHTSLTGLFALRSVVHCFLCAESKAVTSPSHLGCHVKAFHSLPACMAGCRGISISFPPTSATCPTQPLTVLCSGILQLHTDQKCLSSLNSQRPSTRPVGSSSMLFHASYAFVMCPKKPKLSSDATSLIHSFTPRLLRLLQRLPQPRGRPWSRFHYSVVDHSPVDDVPRPFL